jgi:hypothetical protein
VRLGGYNAGWYANGVTVAGTVAYVACESGGLQILDVSNPRNPVRLGGYDTNGSAYSVVLSGTRAYVAGGARWTGSNYVGSFQAIDVSNPANPVRLGGYDTSRSAYGVAVAGSRIYVADNEKGLKVFCTLPNVQQVIRVDGGTLGAPFTIEAAADLTRPVAWTPIFTTNPVALPFEFTDLDVRITAHPQKFYRVRQP